MTKNMGSTDKMIRIIIAIVIAILFYTNVISGTVAIVLGIIALVFALTSFISFCPMYTLLGVSTCKLKK